VHALAKPGQRRRVDLVAGPAQEPRDRAPEPPAEGTAVHQNERRHATPCVPPILLEPVRGGDSAGTSLARRPHEFLVEFEPGRTALDLSELILEEALGRKVDVIQIRRPSPIAERLRREAVPL
jgi:hypothetical protein